MGTTSARRHPLMLGEQPLLTLDEDTDNSGSADDTYLTEEQQATRFMSRWQEKVNPLIRYKGYFESSAKTSGHIFKEIRRFYLQLVVNGNWSDGKFVAVVGKIMSDNQHTVNTPTLDVVGRQYDREQIKTQRRR